ncbi:X-Pro dipeptidyl-peptidase C-terminal non-catalytic domain-containing protein [Aspergillus insuetus]
MVATIQVAIKRFEEPKIGENGYTGFRPGESEVFVAGSQPFGADTRALTSDIRIDHDVEIVVRDGARLYADVYRPADATEKVPAILSWSPYGKKYSSLDMLPMTVWHTCVKRSQLSGLEKFEGLDPAAWCPKGYAIVSVDVRGAGNSDGHVGVLDNQEAEDGYDVVEAVAKMEWCNGNIGMAGNSWLAASQWFIASQQPPSLKAIAPWDGLDDLYRAQFCRGGWFTMSNFELIRKAIMRGKPTSGIEDISEMYRRSPTMNPFWSQKRADMKKIKCPVYTRGADVSNLHNMGPIRAWLEILHDKKWIQWGSYQEWFELYRPESFELLQPFFDRYLRGIENDWERTTPKIRWAALQFGDKPPVHDIVLEDFPVPNTTYKEFFLAENGALSTERSTTAAKVSYNSEDFNSWVEFDHTFREASRLIGLPKCTLYMSCQDQDDFCVFVILIKKDKDGNVTHHLNFPLEATPINSIKDMPENLKSSTTLFIGPLGILRASQRDIDSSRSIHPQFPFHPHTTQRKVPPGTVVKLEIGIYAMGTDYEAGESVTIRIGGQYHSHAEFTAWADPRPDYELSHGPHTLHLGGEYPSSLVLPFIGSP